MTIAHFEVFRKHCCPLEPIPTGEQPVLARLKGIRAVLFDVYGTLFISGSGEASASRESARESALADALKAAGIRPIGPMDQGLDYFFEVIERSHAESRKRGIEYPEVDIVEVWREVVAELDRRGLVERKTSQQGELERLAVEYEARANPVWPMPGLRGCLRAISRRGLLMGLISNAQFYTSEIFPAFLGGPAESWGFDPELQYYSYRYGRAKPGLDLHRMAAEVLRGHGIEPTESLYVGNDMLNDVLPACRVGFRTALFAGDERSLRLRTGDPRLDGILPDAVLTSLPHLNERILP